jgi:hypothetical protein
MRSLYLFLSLLCIFALVACGSEEELIPPVFSNITASGSLGSTTILTTPSQDPGVTISGNIDDFAATIVANSTASGEVAVAVDSSDGSWSFLFSPLEDVNIVSFTASDQRGNLNQMFLTVFHDTTAPLVAVVTQSVDPSPQLVVTFNEALLESSLATAPFSVVNADNTPLIGPLTGALTTFNTVTLTLDGAALPPGNYRLNCPEVRDIATPDGNSIAADYFFDFTIQ